MPLCPLGQTVKHVGGQMLPITSALEVQHTSTTTTQHANPINVQSAVLPSPAVLSRAEANLDQNFHYCTCVEHAETLTTLVVAEL